MSAGPRVLFTTACPRDGLLDLFDIFCCGGARLPVTLPLAHQPGLRFIKQNLPQIDILEYPSWDRFTQVLSRGWDIVGFSFYTFETNDILRMVEHARKAGVRAVWAGNYGALEPSIRSHFDKVFVGYAEAELAQELDVEIDRLQHPLLIEHLGMEPIGYPLVPAGLLYTTRGCPMKCSFCQAPVFAPTICTLPLEAIERVVREYRRRDIQLVIVNDETFGTVPGHAGDVTSLLRKYDLPWACMTRADVLRRNGEEWVANGLVGAFIGLESVHPEVFKELQKRETIEDITEAVRLLDRCNCFVAGSYIIGLEHDTVESVKRDLQRVRQLGGDMLGVTILTPFPQTVLWSQLEKTYRIDTSDWSSFDKKHLVWNHPHLSREDTAGLLQYGYDLFSQHGLRLAHKLASRWLERKGPQGIHSTLLACLHNRLHGAGRGPGNAATDYDPGTTQGTQPDRFGTSSFPDALSDRTV